jgi:long-chain acyl-CoA synthetase
MDIQQLGAVHVPIYPSIRESDYRYVLEHSGVRIIFTSGCDMYPKINNILPDIQ